MSMEKVFELHEERDKERFATIEKKLDQGDARMASIDTKLDTLIEAHNKQKGFIAGFSAAFSLLFATVVGLALYIWRQAVGN